MRKNAKNQYFWKQKMQDNSNTSAHPIDVVITWVDGNDSELAAKRDRFIKEEFGLSNNHGAIPTYFASNNEIKYCVFSILKFASFVRNIFIVTDGQDPNLSDDIQKYFPTRLNSIKIVDHKEIFKGHEQYLPNFNAASINSLIWRIEGLSENFVYFNDDVFLIREVKPDDWFKNNRPVLRGNWRLAPFRKIISNKVKIFINRYIKGNKQYQPKLSFYIRQWKSAKLMGMRFRYFFHCHTPHPHSKKRLEDFFSTHPGLLERNISHRFRSHDQFLVSALANHLEILSGNRQFAKLKIGYIHPYYSERTIDLRLNNCISNSSIKSVCVQSLDSLSKEMQKRIHSWMQRTLEIN